MVIPSCEIPLLWVWFHVVLCPSTGNAILLWLQATKASNVFTIVVSPTSTHIALSLHLILSGFILVSQASVLLQNWRKTLVSFPFLCFPYFLFHMTSDYRGACAGFLSFDWYCRDRGQRYDFFFLGKKENWLVWCSRKWRREVSFWLLIWGCPSSLLTLSITKLPIKRERDASQHRFPVNAHMFICSFHFSLSHPLSLCHCLSLT